MTGCEISAWLCSCEDFCEWFCDYECSIPFYDCRHELAHDMYKIAVDMLETM